VQFNIFETRGHMVDS